MTTYQLFDALPAHIEDALRASIERFGVLVPITVDQNGNVLDGHHRKRIADELGVPYDRLKRYCEDDDERREIAHTLNADRRQLTEDQRRNVVRVLREQGHSTTAIAGALGVSQSQASRDVQQLTREGKLNEPERVKGLDGKSRPSRRPQVLTRNDREQDSAPVLPDLPTRNASIDVKQAKKLAKQTRESSDVSEPMAAPVGTFSTIVADPPWTYSNRATRAAAQDHYDTLTIGQLTGGEPMTPDASHASGWNLAAQVREWAAPQSHLYLWTTSSHLPEALEVMEAWGFTYKTYLVWVKPQMGMGNYFRVSTELVLFGAKGGLRTLDRGRINWFQADRQQHSAKPLLFHDIVAKSSSGPYLEMFARCETDGTSCSCSRHRLGWETWGNQA